jgi:hypothetical protein
MFAQEAVARYQAGAHRQSESRTTFVHAQLDALGTRIAHALDIDLAARLEFEPDRIALDRTRLGSDESVQQAWHAQSMWEIRFQSSEKR